VGERETGVLRSLLALEVKMRKDETLAGEGRAVLSRLYHKRDVS
jgi:hypothetical protein